MSLPTSGWASWYEVMSESSVMVLPVPVGICRLTGGAGQAGKQAGLGAGGALASRTGFWIASAMWPFPPRYPPSARRQPEPNQHNT